MIPGMHTADGGCIYYICALYCYKAADSSSSYSWTNALYSTRVVRRATCVGEDRRACVACIWYNECLGCSVSYLLYLSTVSCGVNIHGVLSRCAKPSAVSDGRMSVSRGGVWYTGHLLPVACGKCSLLIYTFSIILLCSIILIDTCIYAMHQYQMYDVFPSGGDDVHVARLVLVAGYWRMLPDDIGV